MKIEIDKKELWKAKDELTKRKTYSTRMQFGFDEGVKFAIQQVNNLLISGVVRSKRFNKNDLLRAYQAGSLENLDKTIVPTSMEDLKELLQDGEKWYKRYTEWLITYNTTYIKRIDCKEV